MRYREPCESHVPHISTATKKANWTCVHGCFVPYLVTHDKKVEAVVTEDHVLTDTANLETAKDRNLMRPNWHLGYIANRSQRIRLDRKGRNDGRSVSYLHIILAGGREGHGVLLGAGVIDHLDTREARQSLPASPDDGTIDQPHPSNMSSLVPFLY